MKIISHLLSDSAVVAFGWTLVHSVWQGTAIALLTFFALYVLRSYSANVRYVAGVCALTFQVVMSAATFVYYYIKLAASPYPITRPLSNYVPSSVTLENIKYELPITLKLQIWLSAHISELVICWLIGAAFLLVRFAGGWIFTERLRTNAKIVMDKEWRARFGVLIARMNISQTIEFKETARILTPMVIGAFRPAVLIPIGLLSGFSTAQVEAILAHELAHIRRNDYLVNMLQSFVEVVFFFHPAIWWISEKIRTEREHCCDDIALSACGDRVSLAHALVKVAEWQNAPQMAMAFASKKPLLLKRVQRVLGVNPKPGRIFGTLPVMLIALSLIVGVSIYSVAQKIDKPKPKKAIKHTVREKSKSDIEEIRIENEISEAVEAQGVIEIDEEAGQLAEIIADAASEPVHFDISFGNDSLNKKMNEIHKRVQALQNEMQPLNQRIEEINLEMEKQQFEVERYHREIEKIEWKKDQASELRHELMEKRSSLFDRGKKPGQSANETDLDKQLADFEQKIKSQEESISNLNAQLVSTRKEMLKAEEPVRRLEVEIEELNEKINEINGKIGIEALGFEKLENTVRPRVARVPGNSRTMSRKALAPPPPPVPVPAKPAKAAVPPPPPPVPPVKK
jgi:bla regulator protein BlaR1